MTTTYEQGSAARSPSGAPVLTLTGVQKRYGGVRALRGVDLELQAGEVHAIVGENGAGKSTLIKIVSGAETADEGSIVIDGRELTAGSTTSALHAGIATVYQEPHLFGELTVAENLFIGREIRRHGIVDRGAQRERVVELLERIGLSPDLAEVRAADLPVAEQQLVSIAKALSQDPVVLILDEPSAILTDREIETMFTAVRAMRDAGVAVIYISHRLDELAQITDRVTVLRDGAVVASRPTAEFSVRDVAELMVGHVLETRPMDRAPTAAEPALGVEHLTRTTKFADVSFTVRPGEIVALYGLIGCGAGDVIRALYGIAGADSGDVRVNGQVVSLGTPADAVARGMSMLPANRKVQGVFGSKSIAFNISSANLRAAQQVRDLDGPLARAVGRRRLHPPHLDQGTRRRHHGQQPLRWQPAEGGARPAARRAAADPAAGGADAGCGHRRQGRDPPDHRRAGRRRYGGAGGLHRPRRGAVPRRPGPGHALRLGLGRVRPGRPPGRAPRRRGR